MPEKKEIVDKLGQEINILMKQHYDITILALLKFNKIAYCCLCRFKTHIKTRQQIKIKKRYIMTVLINQIELKQFNI